jgi:small-conductance mechanosensitive channel
MKGASKHTARAPQGAAALVRRATAAALLLVLLACVAVGAAPAMPGGQIAPGGAATAASVSRAAADAAPSAAERPAPLAQPGATASQQPIEHAGVIDFLGATIAWYRQLATEERLATEPAEMLFVDDDRQMALETLNFAFQYARAKAALLKSEKAASATIAASGSSGMSDTATLPGLPALVARTQGLQKVMAQLKQQAEQLKAASVAARPSQRAALARQLATVQSQIELDQSRLDSFNSLVEFESTAAAVGKRGAGLSSQIDALERSVPELNAPEASAASGGAPPPAADATARKALAPASAMDNGLLGTVEALIGLASEQSALKGRTRETGQLAVTAETESAPLIARLHELNARADALAAEPGGDDLAANRARKRQFDDLIKRHKIITDALVPLSKQGVVLRLYAANLQRWSDAVDQRSRSQLHRLVLRLSVLGVLLLAIFGAALVWRSLTFRYVQDLRRRRQLLRLRRLTVALVVGLVLLFDFSSQLGTLATVMGLAAAGVALALQNVILSFAGYFFVTGRYGIRVGDRIQIAGISGDVIDIGLFKLALMELAGDGTSRQPTGRVVVFPNSIVFQTNGNFFKQAPGTNFVWNEFRLTLAPDCDYRVAEKRLLQVVEDVYARYRDTVQRQYSNLERDLSMKFESPRPQSRLRLGANGIELAIRYPADTRHAVQVADEISRRALDAIAQDPALSLAMPGTPNLMPLGPSGPPAAESAEVENGRTSSGDPAAPSAMVPAGAEVVVEQPGSEPQVPRPADKS